MMALAKSLAVPIGLLVLWEIYARTGIAPRYVVAPSAILDTLWQMTANGSIFLHTEKSLVRAGAGFAIGSACGIVAGLAAGVLRPVENFYDPVISLTYPVPKIALLPLIFSWFGIGDLSKIVIITTAVFYPTYIASFYGAKSVERVLVWSARNMGATRRQVFVRVVAPAALPQVFNGLRIGLALSFIIMVTSELVAANAGLGYLIGAAQESLRFDIMYVALLVIGLLGFGFDRGLRVLRRRLLIGQNLGTEIDHV
jgi:ABC-type nitrate/sulfonate/bicarbonate transport system permease component